MKLVIALLFAIAWGSAGADEATEQLPSEVIANYLASSDERGDAFTQARQFDNFDYRAVLGPAARKDRAALLSLLQYNERATLVGAGGEDHAALLVALLQIWGDTEFANVLRETSQKSVEGTLGFLEYGGASRVSFPLTYSATGRQAR